MRLEENRLYTADIELGWLESMASNSTIENKLKEAGFIGVSVHGSGSTRAATGRWAGSTKEVSLPEQIKNIQAR